MLSQLLIIGLVISVLLTSGCVKAPEGTAGGGLTGAQIEDQAADAIEKEMQEAVENISIEDIENSLPE